MSLTLTLSFLLASMALAIMPGPDNIFVLTQSLSKGYKHGVIISAGLVSGVLVHTLLATTGVSLLIQQSEWAFSLIKYIGASYLLYLAWKASQVQPMAMNISKKTLQNEKLKVLPLFQKGFLMNVLNPKVSLFFIAFLPQFITKNEWNVSLQMIILGVIFMIQAFVIFSLISILAGKLTSYLNNPKFWKITKWAEVGVLTILGLTLAVAEK